MIEPADLPLVGLIILLVLLAYIAGNVIWNKIHNRLLVVKNDKRQNR